LAFVGKEDLDLGRKMRVRMTTHLDVQAVSKKMEGQEMHASISLPSREVRVLATVPSNRGGFGLQWT